MCGPAYLGHSVHERHGREITNQRFDAMLRLFADGRVAPVSYVARPCGKPGRESFEREMLPNGYPGA